MINAMPNPRKPRSIMVRKKTVKFPLLTIDYPQEGETICANTYTFRITSPVACRVTEVSVDGGSWQPCRESLGYWWYDWQGYPPGKHEIRARILGIDGIEGKSVYRRFQVIIEE